jgi:FemAB-related protein (PEP-CTERM system-associated)
MPPVVLRTLENPRDERWDAYVTKHPLGTFHHLTGWLRVISRAFKTHEPRYLYVERGGEIAGVLPAFAVGGAPFARALVSIPVGVSGGIIADDDEAAELLRDGARAIAERDRLEYIEYKSEKARFPDLPTSDLYFTFRQQLFGDREKQLQAIPRKTRAVIREAERAKLRADFNRTDLEAFYDLYALSLRNLGTPMFPKELFVASLEELGDLCDILTVRATGRIVGCVMNYYFRDVMLPFFAGALPEMRDVGLNNYLYWVMLERGYERGFRVFDFGRSKAGSGAFAFKRHFGMTEVPLEYQYDLVTRKELPDINPTNPKYQKAIELWQKLPVGVTKVVGPLIQRRLP